MSTPQLLLVDDNADMGHIVRALGRRASIDVLHCTDIAGAWAALHKQLPELLLLDMRLIGESGADLAHRVRAEPALARLRIALFSNWLMLDDIVAGLEAGADLVFDKHLVTDSAAWQRRFREILAWSNGRVLTNLVALRQNVPWPTPQGNWPTVYNQAVRQTLARQNAGSLTPVFWRRAVRQTSAFIQYPSDAADWLVPGAHALNESRVASLLGPDIVAVLGATLAEQMWCLLGARESAAFVAALVPFVPGLMEALPH